jgi:hypothetical protein
MDADSRNDIPGTVQGGSAVTGPDRQWSELVEGETPVRKPGGHLLDAVEFGLQVGVVVRVR